MTVVLHITQTQRRSPSYARSLWITTTRIALLVVRLASPPRSRHRERGPSALFVCYLFASLNVRWCELERSPLSVHARAQCILHRSRVAAAVCRHTFSHILYLYFVDCFRWFCTVRCVRVRVCSSCLHHKAASLCARVVVACEVVLAGWLAVSRKVVVAQVCVARGEQCALIPPSLSSCRTGHPSCPHISESAPRGMCTY